MTGDFELSCAFKFGGEMFYPVPWRPSVIRSTILNLSDRLRTTRLRFIDIARCTTNNSTQNSTDIDVKQYIGNC